MKSNPTKRDNTKYCEFHRDHGHRTNDCIHLRKEIEYLIRRGHLRHYVASEGQDQVQPPPPCQPTLAQHQLPLGEIHVISGGFVGGGESSSARKAHLHSIRSGEALEIQAVSKLPQLDTTITFSDSYMEGCQHPHDNPLVIKAVVANKTIHGVLVDNGSSADIIFSSAFDKMGIGREKLEPISAYLRGFSEERVLPLGDPLCQATITVRFLIVDALCQANVVLVKKANGKWLLCIDFTDINRAYPKDSFPLPRADLIVDAIAGHELLSFMDAFSSYNQISMDPNDQEKTSFVTG